MMCIFYTMMTIYLPCLGLVNEKLPILSKSLPALLDFVVALHKWIGSNIQEFKLYNYREEDFQLLQELTLLFKPISTKKRLVQI